MNLSEEQSAVISDRQRLWEVRKYAQVRPELAREHIDNGKPVKEASSTEPCPPASNASTLR